MNRILSILLAALTGLVVTVSVSASPVQAATDCSRATLLSLTYLPCEVQNIALSTQSIVSHKDLLPGLAQATLAYQKARDAALAKDHERQPNPNSCTTVVLCEIDPRLENWTSRGGIVEPVLYTSRSGATMSGHIWATKAGPAKRAGVFYINGSIIGYEQAYWFIAQSLAKAGFVVMTFDAQGEGMSDQFGEKPDQTEDAFAGIPGLGILGPLKVNGLSLGGNGLPFYDGGTDALDFFTSTPAKPYVPRASRSSGTSHNAKQVRRVKAGLNSAYNPLWKMLDSAKIGVSGHSYGAEAASWLAQSDPRIDAAVIADNLCIPVSPSPDEVASFTAPNPDFGGLPHLPYGFNRNCFGAPPGPAPAITKPALGITGDYIAPVPYLIVPHPLGKSRASLAYSAAGVDSGQIIIRGGSHIDFADETQGLPSTLRGVDITAWYTTAWFKKYLQKDPKGEAMLLTQRWRNDAAAGKIDPARDPNILSWHFRSRLDIGKLNGTAFQCENLRTGCTGQTTAANDGWTGPYSFVIATH